LRGRAGLRRGGWELSRQLTVGGIKPESGPRPGPGQAPRDRADPAGWALDGLFLPEGTAHSRGFGAGLREWAGLHVRSPPPVVPWGLSGFCEVVLWLASWCGWLAGWDRLCYTLNCPESCLSLADAVEMGRRTARPFLQRRMKPGRQAALLGWGLWSWDRRFSLPGDKAWPRRDGP
jgi:hypothetical protein